MGAPKSEDDGFVTVYQTGSKENGSVGKRGPRTCNRHDDCDAADAKARERGRYADHCHDDCCEDCFGS
jgi:hypothetical protein